MKTKTRTGKIARLPLEIRSELNRRLAEGEPGKALLAWLNADERVLAVLKTHFGGRLILEQNLSEWRRGGYREWQAQEEDLQQVRQLAEVAESIRGLSPGLLIDKLCLLLIHRLGLAMAQTMSDKDWSSGRNRKLLQEHCESLTALRRGEHRAEQLRLEREQIHVQKVQLHLAAEQKKAATSPESMDWIVKMLWGSPPATPDPFPNDPLVSGSTDPRAIAPVVNPETPLTVGENAHAGHVLGEDATQVNPTESNPIKP